MGKLVFNKNFAGLKINIILNFAGLKYGLFLFYKF